MAFLPKHRKRGVAGYAARRVLAAFVAAAPRAVLLRFAELLFACRDNSFELAPLFGSRFNARKVARDLVRDGS
jgi:hypothetical protein